jgi:hypothetical protein
MLQGGRRGQRELRRSPRTVRVCRKLPETPRNLYQDLIEPFNDRDNRKDNGRNGVHTVPGEETG